MGKILLTHKLNFMTKIDLKSLEKERLSNSESKNIYGGDLSRDINNGIGEAVYDEDAQADFIIHIGDYTVGILEKDNNGKRVLFCAAKCNATNSYISSNNNDHKMDNNKS